jgi:hypothetical protein
MFTSKYKTWRLDLKGGSSQSRPVRSPKLTESGYLLYPMASVLIDVLGMKKLMTSHSLEDLAKIAMRPFGDQTSLAVTTNQISEDDVNVKDLGFYEVLGPIVAMVSDSILALFPTDQYTENDHHAAVETVVDASRFLARAIAFNSQEKIWLRGAVSYGEILLGEADGLILLGEPIVEAYSWERNQLWIGGMLAPSAARIVQAASLEVGKPISMCICPWLAEYEIPLKSGKEESRFPRIAVNWICGPPAWGL